MDLHDAEEKMLRMTMGCDGPHSDRVFKHNRQNDKQLFHQVQRQENVKQMKAICWNNWMATRRIKPSMS